MHAPPELLAAEAEARGDWAAAAAHWAAACDFGRAGRAALQAGDAAAALAHAARARDGVTERAALDALPAPRRAGVAARLAAAGLLPAAGRAFAAAGDAPAALGCFEEAGAWLEVAALHEAAGELARALAALERARAEEPGSAALAARAAALTARLGLDAPVPQALGARFRVGRALGTTPLARVFAATDALDGAAVTVQVFRCVRGAPGDDAAVARFERAVRALGRLGHPAIVPLRAYHPEGPTLVLGDAGASLHERHAAGRPSPARAVEMVRAVLAALDAAHRAGVLHGELSPHAVFVDAAGGVRVGDFALGALRAAAATATLDAEGSRAFLAPEQRAGAAPSVAGDVYGAGALLWWLLAGAPPPLDAPLDGSPPAAPLDGALAGAPAGAALDPLPPDAALLEGAPPGVALHADAPDGPRAALRRLLGPAALRPSTAEAARALLGRWAWSAREPPRAPGPAAGRAAPTGGAPTAGDGPSTGSPRFVPIEGARHRDTWLEREVLLLAATREALALARAFAGLDDAHAAALPLGVDGEGRLLVEALAPLDRAPTPAERAALDATRAALERAGVTARLEAGARAGLPAWRFPADPAPDG